MEILRRNGTTGYASDRDSKITSFNDTVRAGSVMFDIKELGTGNFENNTTVGKSTILKSDKANHVNAKNNVAYADPSARLNAEHKYNVGDWFDFLEDHEEAIISKKPEQAERIVNNLQVRLHGEWKSLPKNKRLANESELKGAIVELKGSTFNEHYRDWPPNFIERPCD